MYQVRPPLNPWFSPVFAADISYRNHFFQMKQCNICAACNTKHKSFHDC